MYKLQINYAGLSAAGGVVRHAVRLHGLGHVGIGGAALPALGMTRIPAACGASGGDALSSTSPDTLPAQETESQAPAAPETGDGPESGRGQCSILIAFSVSETGGTDTAEVRQPGVHGVRRGGQHPVYRPGHRQAAHNAPHDVSPWLETLGTGYDRHIWHGPTCADRVCPVATGSKPSIPGTCSFKIVNLSFISCLTAGGKLNT